MLITLNDIAHKAGVSVTTVSRVLNKKSKKYRIAEETKNRVLSVAKDLNYQPNQLARGLRLKRTNTFGLIVPDISNPFFAHVTRMIQKYAHDFGYSLIVCNTDENLDVEIEHVNLLRGKGVDGFIIMPVGLEKDHISELVALDKPLVFLDRYFADLPTNSVIIDNFSGTYSGTEHLIDYGHRDIAIIQGLRNTSTNTERVRGYRQALEDHDIPVNDRYIVGNDFRKDNGYIETKILLGLTQPPSAIFTMSDLITLGAMEAIYEQALSIPEDISIISFDDVDFAPFMKAPLTAVRQPKEMMGRMAVKLLIEDIESKGKRSRQNIVLKPDLVLRQSVQNLHLRQRGLDREAGEKRTAL